MIKKIIASFAIIALIVVFAKVTQDVPTDFSNIANNIEPGEQTDYISSVDDGSGEQSLYDNDEPPLADKIICVDAGHCVFTSRRTEPIAPNSNIMKAAFVEGTHGATLTEEQLNLIVALKLEERLKENGASVLMTRTTAECDMSNVDRAMMANEAGVDLAIRIHADGSENKEIQGISLLVPAGDYISDTEMIEKSRMAGEFILEETVMATGAINRGISERSDMTGFNWSTVPVILIEMGFMTNPDEDRLLSTDEYQDKIVDGIIKGVKIYFNEKQ